MRRSSPPRRQRARAACAPATPSRRRAPSRPTWSSARATRPRSARRCGRSSTSPPRSRAASRQPPTAPSSSTRPARRTSSPARRGSRRRSLRAALEPLLFVLRGLVERAVARVGLEGIGVARLGLALGLEDRSRDERAVPLAAPTRDVKTLLTCLRAELEARPPRAAVERVVLAAVPEVVRAAQLGLFNPAGPSPELLATTLARLAALCGAERVGAPAVIDSHRPGAAGVAPFTLGGAPA